MRQRLADRRPNETIKITWGGHTGGPDHKLLVTFGFNNAGQIKEAFIASFRAESSFCALVNDARMKSRQNVVSWLNRIKRIARLPRQGETGPFSTGNT